MINLERFKNQCLETEPYRWAAITGLYTPDDAEKRAATYPCDHVKLVSAYGQFLTFVGLPLGYVVPLETHVCHYGHGGNLGVYKKIVNHVLYFNRSWNPALQRYQAANLG